MNKLDTDCTNLVWNPEYVIFEGKKYKAPLDLLPIIVNRTLKEMLIKRLY